jgi:hypothetical protein
MTSGRELISRSAKLRIGRAIAPIPNFRRPSPANPGISTPRKKA